MDRKLRNRTLLLLVLAGIIAFVLVRISGRQPVAKIAATRPVRQNVIASISSNGKVEPISPYTVRAQLDTFVQKVYASEGQNVKKGQLLLELDVKDVTAQLSADLVNRRDEDFWVYSRAAATIARGGDPCGSGLRGRRDATKSVQYVLTSHRSPRRP